MVALRNTKEQRLSGGLRKVVVVATSGIRCHRTMQNIGWKILFGVAWLFGLTACQHQPFSGPPIFEDQSQYVRLAVDRSVGGGHSHPANLGVAEMSSVLSGVMVEESPHLLPPSIFSNKDKEPHLHPAFGIADISFLAPLLVKGLESAKPHEIVTFYRITQQPGTIDLVTSGGVYIHGEELHFVLSNYRTPARYPPDAETMSYVDGRSTPLQSIAPQEAKLDFQPSSALVPQQEGLLKNPLRAKRREIVVWFKKLTEEPTSITHESH